MKCQKEIFLLRGGRQNAILWAAGIPTPEQSTCLDGRLPSSVVEELSTGTALSYRYCWPGHYCSYVVCQETMFRNIFGPADLATYYCWFTMVHSQDRTHVDHCPNSPTKIILSLDPLAIKKQERQIR